MPSATCCLQISDILLPTKPKLGYVAQKSCKERLFFNHHIARSTRSPQNNGHFFLSLLSKLMLGLLEQESREHRCVPTFTMAPALSMLRALRRHFATPP